MYVCGITPYDKSHLGHARTFVSFDIIRRYLLFRGFSVTYVQNVTDMDDKIINRAKERKVAPLELSDKYAALREGIRNAGNNEARRLPKVSECIPEIIGLIQQIEKNGYAYATRVGSLFRCAANSGPTGSFRARDRNR